MRSLLVFGFLWTNFLFLRSQCNSWGSTRLFISATTLWAHLFLKNMNYELHYYPSCNNWPAKRSIIMVCNSCAPIYSTYKMKFYYFCVQTSNEHSRCSLIWKMYFTTKTRLNILRTNDTHLVTSDHFRSVCVLCAIFDV